MDRIQLSENFYLDEFTRSEVAARLGREVALPESCDYLDRARRLCRDLLQPVRDRFGPVRVLSGFRPPWLNRAVGGSPISGHMSMLAADFVVAGHPPLEVARWMEAEGLPFDQVIHEFGRWTHAAIAAPGSTPRREVLTAYRQDGRTVYAPGLHDSKDLRGGIA